MGAAWRLHGGGVEAECRGVGAAWGRRGGGVEAASRRRGGCKLIYLMASFHYFWLLAKAMQ